MTEHICDQGHNLLPDGTCSENCPVPCWDESARCSQCGKPMNPVARMMGPVCGVCVRKNHKQATRLF